MVGSATSKVQVPATFPAETQHSFAAAVALPVTPNAPRHVGDMMVRRSTAMLEEAISQLPDRSTDSDTVTESETSSCEDMSQDDIATPSEEDATTENFIKPKRTVKRKLPRSPKGISTQNKFAAIAVSQDEKSAPVNATTSSETQPKKTRIPPIFLKNKEKWTATSCHFAATKIKFNRASNTGQGIKIEPATSTDYRHMVHFFEREKCEFFTYALPEDKPLSAVIRGVPLEFTETEVTQDLAAKGFKILKVMRMKKGHDRSPMPLVMVHLARSEHAKEIFNITEIHRVDVTVETPKARTDITQCFRCQGFGHTQRECRIKPKCVKCAGEHFAADCSKTTRDTPATCINCGGAHPANYRGCPSYPKMARQRPAARNAPPSVESSPKAWPTLKKPSVTPRRTAPAGSSNLRQTREPAAPPEKKSPHPRTANERADRKPTNEKAEKEARRERTDRRRNSSNTDQRRSSSSKSGRNDFFTPENVSGLISLVFRIGSGLNKARSKEEAIMIIADFSAEICSLCRSYD